MNAETTGRVSLRRGPFFLLACIVVVAAAIALARVGMLDLPSVPRGVTAESAGLASLDQLAALDAFVRGDAAESSLTAHNVSSATLDAAKRIRAGRISIAHGDEIGGLAAITEGVHVDPSNLVLCNVYRLAVFKLQRAYLARLHETGVLTPTFPEHLRDQPIAFLEALAKRNDSREVRLQLALAWVDKMLLFPALEIKAPSSVEAVNILTGIIDSGEESYVPALFGRGLNHLHRPARLVWPESDTTPPDAAAQDIGMCVAIGRKLGTGSDRLQARLAVTLGDAYVKAGRYSVARSWWQIAQNLCHDDDIQHAVRRRYAWSDEEILDQLELELDRARSELDQPMTDLAMMWD